MPAMTLVATDLYVADGIQDTYTVSFPYIKKDDVNIKLNLDVLVVDVDYEWINDSAIRFLTIPTENSLIKFWRNTEHTMRLVDFQDGAVLREADLDLAMKQVFYLSQEIADGYLYPLENALVTLANNNGIVTTDADSSIAELVEAILNDAAAGGIADAIADIAANTAAAAANAQDLVDQAITLAQLTVDLDAAEITIGDQTIDISNLMGDITTLETTVDDNSSSITTLQGTTSTLAADLTALTTTVGDNTSSITTLDITTGDNATSITNLTATLNDAVSDIIAAESSISNLQTVTSDTATDLTALTTTVGDNTSSIGTLNTTTGDNASAITTLQTDVGDNSSSITTLNTTTSNNATAITNVTTTADDNTASIGTLQTTTDGLEARYGVSLDVNDYVTGFVQNNDGTSGSFDILADSFNVVDPANGLASPVAVFSVTGGVVYATNLKVTNAEIEDLQVNKLTSGSLGADVTIDTGTITLSSSGHIKGGQTAYDTGAGFFLGRSGGDYKFSIGDGGANKLIWDGTTLTVTGDIGQPNYEAGTDTELLAGDTERTSPAASTAWTKRKTFVIGRAGTVRVEWDDKVGTWDAGTPSPVVINNELRIMVDGVQSHLQSVGSGSYTSRNHTATCSGLSTTIDIEVRTGFGAVPTDSYRQTYVRNASINIVDPAGDSVTLD